jgi:succinate dehydrogenase (ubiquinone) membrane anchor subunit
MLLAGLTPLAFVVPSSMVMPFDVVLGVLFPLHSHIAMNYVISDYIPKSTRTLARGALLLTTVVATVGLLKLNLSGDGMTKSVKSLWEKPKITK